ncbi:TetR/AcrR family transcriptional regulator [Brooklawnia cerclae]|uniref:AcrR family transcriptional regulator n=1 Tax=Brooklawnia cerclae TaxID=349934 RepID=A0ABX0SJH7_9ACTN|nr:TetR/AcrR family transcriptional regulator [Brooklawnia cerclae]NIH58135.1 AcrR family transcriptional regulator [Brooklawnia cerclae]
MARIDRRRRTRLDPDARRSAIVEAARLLFAHDSYEKVAVTAVADQAGTSEALVYHYFDSKADLYVEVIGASMARLGREQDAATDALPASADARDRIRVRIEVLLDHLSGERDDPPEPFLLPGNDPSPAVVARRRMREEAASGLRSLLHLPEETAGRDDYALLGFLGFLDAACLAWVARGCPDQDRRALVETASDALFGALRRRGT